MISCHGWAGGTQSCFKGRQIETSLGVPRVCCNGAYASRWIPCQLSWRMVPASVRHTSFFGVRPRSGHLQANGCTRWLLDGCFTTNARTSTRSHRCIPLSLGMSPPLILLLSWLVTSCVPRVTCDFVPRLGGWDTILFQRTAD